MSIDINLRKFLEGGVLGNPDGLLRRMGIYRVKGKRMNEKEYILHLWESYESDKGNNDTTES